MNTETTGQQAEVTADAAVDAVDTVIWRHEHGQEIFSGMLKDANEAVIALQQLAVASERVTQTFSDYGKAQGLVAEAQAHRKCEAAMLALEEANAACRAVGGAR